MICQPSEALRRSNMCFTCGMHSRATDIAPSTATYVKLYQIDHVNALNPSGAYSPKNITPESTAHM